jgi:hypothetical protein
MLGIHDFPLYILASFATAAGGTDHERMRRG